MKIFIKAAILSLVIVIAAILCTFVILNRPTSHIPVTGYELEVVSGMNTHKLARLLSGEKVIRSPKLFIIMIRERYHFYRNTISSRPMARSIAPVSRMCFFREDCFFSCLFVL